MNRILSLLVEPEEGKMIREMSVGYFGAGCTFSDVAMAASADPDQTIPHADNSRARPIDVVSQSGCKPDTISTLIECGSTETS